MRLLADGDYNDQVAVHSGLRTEVAKRINRRLGKDFKDAIEIVSVRDAA